MWSVNVEKVLFDGQDNIRFSFNPKGPLVKIPKSQQWTKHLILFRNSVWPQERKVMAAGKDWKKVKSAVTINAALGNIVWYNNNQEQ